MKNEINKVAEFHRTFGHPVRPLTYPINENFSNMERMQLRIRLLREEVDELEQAIEDSDSVESLDALADISVILFGTAVELGYGDVMPEAFKRVMKSNMSKLCKSEKELNDTKKKYWSEGIDVISKKVHSGYVVMRKSDNKILKNAHYKTAYSMLLDLLEEQKLPKWKRTLRKIGRFLTGK